MGWCSWSCGVWRSVCSRVGGRHICDDGVLQGMCVSSLHCIHACDLPLSPIWSVTCTCSKLHSIQHVITGAGPVLGDFWQAEKKAAHHHRPCGLFTASPATAGAQDRRRNFQGFIWSFGVTMETEGKRGSDVVVGGAAKKARPASCPHCHFSVCPAQRRGFFESDIRYRGFRHFPEVGDVFHEVGRLDLSDVQLNHSYNADDHALAFKIHCCVWVNSRLGDYNCLQPLPKCLVKAADFFYPKSAQIASKVCRSCKRKPCAAYDLLEPVMAQEAARAD